jgi:hypothetical protein
MKRKTVMKKLFFLMVVIFGLHMVYAQTVPQAPLTPAWGWKHSVVSGLTLSQISFRDWAQGGEDALAWTARLDGSSRLDDTTFSWSNGYKLSYGEAKIGGGDPRKTEDRIEFESIFTYKMGIHINPYLAASLKTQFAEGVTIDATGKATPVSQFFDPAYITQSLGLGYQPIPEVKTRLGAALREIVTSTYRGYANSPSTPIAEWVSTKVDGGIEWITDVEWKIQADALLRSKLELFSPVRKVSEVTMRMDNTISVNIAKYFVVVLDVQLINDPNASTRTQVKEALEFGLTYVLF